MSLNKAKIAHLLRAAAGVTGHSHFVMIGSGSTVARYRPVPIEMMQTREIDLYVENDPEASDTMGVLLGQNSDFDTSYGYYVDGVSPTTAQMPEDWRDRAAIITLPMAPGITCLCPEVHDIGAAKMCAWREKNIDWLKAGLTGGLLRIEKIRERLDRIRHPQAPPGQELMRRVGRLETMISGQTKRGIFPAVKAIEQDRVKDTDVTVLEQTLKTDTKIGKEGKDLSDSSPLHT